MDFPSGQVLDGSTLASDEQVECDVVVVGSGAGGLASAWQLSQLGLSVLVLEEGRRWEPGQLSTRQSWALRNLYAERGTTVAIGNVFLPLPRGRAVGGSTLLNSAICFRPPGPVLAGWREDFGVDWADAERLEPLVGEVERAIGVVKTYPAIAREHNLLFKRGAEAIGLRGDFISRNAPGCIGCGLCQLGCPVGGKGSVDRTLLPVALSRGAALVSSARVRQVLVDRGGAVGVEAWTLDPLTEQPKRRLEVRAQRVFLCGGAVNTPMLLLRQGLANSSGQVGNNLHVHSAVGLCARFEQVVDAWHGVTQGYYAHLPGERAVLETFSTTPDLYSLQYEASSRPAERLRHLASCGCMIGDVSSGTVRPGPAESRSSMSYNVEAEDVRVMKKGLREIARAYFAVGALDVNPGFNGVPPLPSLEALDRVLESDLPPDRMGIYASHPMSTCRMSGDRARGVVRPDGECWDVPNLIIADASVFPTSLGVNPQITVMTAAAVIARAQAARG